MNWLQPVAGQRLLGETRDWLVAILRMRDGAATVEAAIMLPLTLTFLFGVMEAARALWLQNSLSYAVEDAARCAAINPSRCGSASAIQNYAVSRVHGFRVPATTFSYSTPACGKEVTASYTLSTWFPLSLMSSSLQAGNVSFNPTLSAQSCHPS